jgi:hypothetical protein
LSKYEFRLIPDVTNVPKHTSNSSINITPVAYASNNEDRPRLRPATKSSTYISDQIDRAREQEDNSKIKQQQQQSSSTSWKSWAIIITVFLVVFLLYYNFGIGSISANDEHLYDLD